jgi:hypothetical protein
VKVKDKEDVMMEYTVICISHHKYIEEFIEKVNQYIQEGWQPLGGIAVGDGWWSQAMIRSKA